MKVLIVDDSPDIRTALALMVRNLRNVEIVGEAGTVEQSLRALAALHPDLVVVDIRLPDGDGFEVIQRAKAMRPAPVVAVLTNYPYPQYRTRCRDLGADYFFDKCGQFSEVSRVCEELTAGRIVPSGVPGSRRGATGP